MNLCPGKSVGAIIRDKDGALLVLYRKKKPLGLALPAGHIDEGETPADAVQREVYEETGLEVKRYREVLHRTFPNPCSRTDAAGKSYDGHEWWVYEVVEWKGVPRLMEPAKHEFVAFIAPGFLHYSMDLGPGRTPDPADATNWDPAWQEHILPALGII